MRRRARRLPHAASGTSALAAIACLAAACAAAPVASAPETAIPRPDPVELSVFAAASLRDVLSAVTTAYEAAAPGTTLTIATDSSAALRAQIEQGAPADVFLSADQENPQALVEAGLSDGNAVPFARNRLTVIVPTDNPAGITSPADLASPGVEIIAAGPHVPITRYAAQAVGNLAALPGYPTDFAAAYVGNLVSGEENVRAIVTRIELGEGDAAIVYVTDAQASSTVKAIEIPPAANVAATYEGIVVMGSNRAAEARAFLGWLAGPRGTSILARFGFLGPS